MRRHIPHLHARAGVRRSLLGTLLVVLPLAVAPVQADLVRGAAPGESSPRPVFELIAAAWERGDEQALADLVHRDGLRVTSGATGERAGNYSPSQAYYYFKNLFRARRTLLFEFRVMQDGRESDRAHGMAVWQRRRVDSEKIEEFKVICVLAREDDRWRLAELNTIR